MQPEEQHIITNAQLSPQEPLKSTDEQIVAKLDEILFLLRRAYPSPREQMKRDFIKGMIVTLGSTIGAGIIFLILGLILAKLVIIPLLGPMLGPIMNTFSGSQGKSTIDSVLQLYK